MRRRSALVVTVIVVAVLTTVAAAGANWWVLRDHDSQMQIGSGMMGSAGSAGAASESEYLATMVAHHQEAVAAARELARSDQVELRSFGAEIVKIQSAQIEQMQRWLEDWYPDQSTAVDYRPMMRDLSGLSGDRLDEAFLEDMIGHHMAAVMMSQQLLRLGTDHGQVAELARSIRDDQHTEIVQMQRWLAQWFDADWHTHAHQMGQ